MSNSDEHRLLDALYSDEEPEGLSAEQSQELSELSDTLSMMRQLDEVEPPPFMATRILAEAKSLQSTPTGWRKWIARIASPAGGLVATAGLAAIVVVATLPVANQMSPASEEPASVAVKAAPEQPSVVPTGVGQELNEEVAAGGKAEGLALDRAEQKAAEPMAEAEADGDSSALGASRRLRKRSKAKSRVRRTFPADAREVPAEKAADKEARDEGGMGDLKKAASTGRMDSDTVDDLSSRSVATPPAAAPRAAAPRPPPPPSRAKKPSGNRGAPSKGVAGPETAKSGEGQSPETVAETFLRAANAELKAGRRRAARQVLARGIEQTRGKAAQAGLYLRWAEIELEDRQPTVAQTYLASARKVPGFKEHKRAQVIERRIAALKAEMSAP